MGFAIPDHLLAPPPAPPVDPMVEQARALIVPEMEELSKEEYGTQRTAQGFDNTPVQTRFQERKMWYKAAQESDNGTRREYVALLKATVGIGAPYKWSDHHKWLAQEIETADRMGQLATWPLERLIHLAEDAAAWALEQAERRACLLMHRRWGMGNEAKMNSTMCPVEVNPYRPTQRLEQSSVNSSTHFPTNSNNVSGRGQSILPGPASNSLPTAQHTSQKAPPVQPRTIQRSPFAARCTSSQPTYQPGGTVITIFHRALTDHLSLLHKPPACNLQHQAPPISYYLSAATRIRHHALPDHAVSATRASALSLQLAASSTTHQLPPISYHSHQLSLPSAITHIRHHGLRGHAVAAQRAISPQPLACNLQHQRPPISSTKSASRYQPSLLSAILLWQTMPCYCYASYQPSARKVNYQLYSTVNHHRCAITFIRYRVSAYRPGTTTRAFNLSLKTHHQSVTINQLQWIDHQ
ncbi:hypothetical protein AUP68_00302 [Ilyonectria robusta]